MKKGTLCISIDTELIWGRTHLKNIDEFTQRAKKDWKTIPAILKLLKKYQAPTTWALTGHMFLDHCDGIHKEIIRPNYSWSESDWFKFDPGTNQSKNPEWYGKGLFQLIKQQKMHEIGCHTYSHFVWGDPNFSAVSAETDIAAWTLLAKKNGVKSYSFVFPRNSVGYLPILSKYGFTTYRGVDQTWYKNSPKVLQHFFQILDFLLPLSPETVTPQKTGKVINIPGSYYFPSARGIRKYIPKGMRAWKAKKGIDKAISKGEIFHLWTHPVDFSDQTPKLMSDFEEILNYASKKVNEGKLEIKTMKDISLSH